MPTQQEIYNNFHIKDLKLSLKLSEENYNLTIDILCTQIVHYMNAKDKTKLSRP